MTATLRLACVGLAIALALTARAGAGDGVRVYTSADPMMRLGTVEFQGGNKLELSLGIGSGAFRHHSLPANVFQTISDRGPNFTCKSGVKLTGLTRKQLCGRTKHARIYPLPRFAPAIYTVELLPDSTFRVLDVLTLKDRDGRPLTGLPNPLVRTGTEIPFDAHGRRLAQDPNALDTEALVRLDDGTYWVAEENAPSIVHIGADGRVLKRLVPAGAESDFEGADYPVEGRLPAILSRRHLNRGIESLAVSADEKFLYFAMQSPLDNPDTKAFARSRNLRIFKVDRARERVVGEYLYVLDTPDTFIKDSNKDRKQSAVKVSEMMGFGRDRVIVLERVTKTSKLYEADLTGATNILGGKWDDPSTTPSLELASPPAAVRPVAKTLVFSTDDHDGLPKKIEGLADLGGGTIAFVNDDDFGIDGNRTVIATVQIPALARPARDTPTK